MKGVENNSIPESGGSVISRSNRQVELFLDRVGVESAEIVDHITRRPPINRTHDDIPEDEDDLIATFKINRKTGDIIFKFPNIQQ